MARLARAVFPSVAHHVTQRGDGRAQTFFGDADDRFCRGLRGIVVEGPIIDPPQGRSAQGVQKCVRHAAEGHIMLTEITSTHVHRIAQLAKVARDARDGLLHGLPEEIVGEPHPARGEQDRMGAGGFDVLPADDPAVTALRGAISGLKPAARSELFSLMRIGQGELGPGDWQRGLSEATTLGDESVGGILADDINLQSHLEKGLYGLGAA
jgi:hypothetical protein